MPLHEALLPLTSLEFSYGFGVYETLRVDHGQVRFMEDHCERLLVSARIIGLEHTFTQTNIAAWIPELTATCDAEAYNLKMLLIGGKTAAEASLYILPLPAYFPERKLWRDGCSVVTYAYERPFPQAKTLGMLGSYVAYREARAQGAYDALLINHRGQITEGSRTNVFAVRGGAIVSPPEEHILAGVTRKHVLQAAAKLGLEVRYETIPLADITTYDGFFLTSTSSKVMPVANIDQFPFAIPPCVRRLQEAFQDSTDVTSEISAA